ncbi:MAG: hypothetical protein JOZ27_07605 [Caulobacteraceae bacterium]|nr:hypothetical protein [Caulobacteraceae bacterium]
MTPVAARSTSPPRAAIAFRVGIVGHRPDRLPDDAAGRAAIRRRLGEVLIAARDAVRAFAATPDAGLYAAGEPLLRAISSLAEGADRDFADEALRLGFGLCCPMPFPREEFAKDFGPEAELEPESARRFARLLSGAPTIFELDGDRAQASAAYEAAAGVVLNQSDLLVVVWDGGDARGQGGTAHTLQEAIAYRVPVLWIDAQAPFGWRLLRAPEDVETLGARSGPSTPENEEDRAALAVAVRAVVDAELSLPDPGGGDAGGQREKAETYFRQKRPALNGAVLWKLFRDGVGEFRLRWPRWRVPDFVRALEADWPGDAGGAEGEAARPAHWVNDRLRAHYAWSDGLADLRADAHRSTFVVASLLAVTAVFLALLPFAMGWDHPHRIRETAAVLAELVVLGAMLWLLSTAQRRRWHEHWLEYRVLAELIRQLQILIPMGGGRPLPRTPAHLAVYGDPVRSWMYWQVRAITRAVGLPTVRVTSAYTQACLDHLEALAADQRRFHAASQARSGRIHRRLHAATVGLLVVSILGVGLHLAVFRGGVRLPPDIREAVSRWLVVLSAITPALGAALASINNQGEFARLAKRSRSMASGFARFEARIAGLRAELEAGRQVSGLARAAALAADMGEMMVEENVDWRVVVLDLPHVAG